MFLGNVVFTHYSGTIRTRWYDVGTWTWTLSSSVHKGMVLFRRIWQVALKNDPSLPATFRESGWITCSFSPSPTGLGELSLDQSHFISGWTHSSRSFLSCSCSPSFCPSFRPWGLSPVLQCGSLSQSPSINGWRFPLILPSLLTFSFLLLLVWT